MIAASNGWVVGFDNLSYVKADLSDGLCALATGAGFATRELYSDDDEKLFAASRPILLNGIAEVATRPDLLDRSITIALPQLANGERQSEGALRESFGEAKGGILGALFDAVSAALANVDSVELDELPRMADFAKWIVAAEPALPWDSGGFMAAYAGNREQAVESTIEASPIGQPLLDLIRTQRTGDWSGSPGDFLERLNDDVEDSKQRPKGWPTNAKGVSDAIRRLAPSLRQLGIEVTFSRSKTGRKITLTRQGEDTPKTASSAPSASPAPSDDATPSHAMTQTDVTDDAAVTQGDAAVTQANGLRHRSKLSSDNHLGANGDAGDAGDATAHTQSSGPVEIDTDPLEERRRRVRRERSKGKRREGGFAMIK